MQVGSAIFVLTVISVVLETTLHYPIVFILNGKAKVKQSHYRPEVPRGFQEFKFPRFRGNSTGWW